MSEVGNALRMMFLLQCKGKLKAKDLGRMLEVDERTVRRYKEALEQAGLYILSETGKYGGYRLLNTSCLVGLDLSEQELTSLLLIEKHLNDSNHVCSKDFTRVVEKVSVIRKNKKEGQHNIEFHMAKATVSNVNIKMEQQKLLDIHSAVLLREKIEIRYISLASGIIERIIWPYATFEYKNDMYFMGYCELRKEVRHFKLCRIEHYEMLGEQFPIDESFDLKKSMENCLGIYMDDEIDVKLLIDKTMSQIIREKIWVPNQKITEVEGGAIIFEARMRGLTEIKTWILGMGKACRVIGPERLREEIRKEIEEMLKLIG